MAKPAEEVARCAYKVFIKDGERLWFEYYAHCGRSVVPRNKWIQAERPPGFFVFLTRERAKRWRDIGWVKKVVRTVYVRGITHQGAMRVYIGGQRVETYPPAACAKWLFVPGAKT